MSENSVVVKLKAASKKDESVTLSDNVIKLEVNGNTYDPDSDGSVARVEFYSGRTLIGSDASPLYAM